MDREHLAVMVQESTAKWGERTALRSKDQGTGTWEEISWSVLGEQVRTVAKGLLEMGVQARSP